MDKGIAEAFLKKISEDSYSENEHENFLDSLRQSPTDQVDETLELYGQFFKSLPEDALVEHSELIRKIESRLDNLVEEDVPVPRKLWPDYSMIAAVACMLLLIIGFYFLDGFRTNRVKDSVQLAMIVPGSNKATLTLPNGAQIALDSTTIGANTMTGELLEGYNTISTPVGGAYQFTLSDGTMVWLNAASSIRFPAAFKGNERHVVLNGEAYFEVAKNKAKPFRVTANETQIQVLGTHFNVTAYKDDNLTGSTTTLLEGSVKIIKGKQSRMIIPGEQADVKEAINVSTVDVNAAIEWKNGNFNFSHENFESIMKKISRWYDVEIEYQGAVTQEGFVGTVPRSKNISEVLHRLELTGLVHFKIVGRRVIVMP